MPEPLEERNADLIRTSDDRLPGDFRLRGEPVEEDEGDPKGWSAAVPADYSDLVPQEPLGTTVSPNAEKDSSQRKDAELS